MHLFTPNHVHLISACYPPSSALPTAGPEYKPNSQELSRLTYYAANRPGKINKLGGELQRRVRTESHKAQSGNIRARASLLITLAILRALTTECRRDLSPLSTSVLACVRTTLEALPSDLEVCARAASVFTAWCTFTDGHIFGVDADLTQNYIAILRGFSAQSTVEIKSVDSELRNRTRLVGLAAITGVVNSEVLYNSSRHFQSQVSVIMRPLLFHVLKSELPVLEERASSIKDTPLSPYLDEFRARPILERRAASIHIHIDGESGPSSNDVLDASLRALSSLLQHSNGGQVGSAVQASFDSLDDLNGWKHLNQCRWFAQRACEWTQYQYRYAVPTRLVERLLETQDSPVATPQQNALTSMVTTVFNSSVALVNLSTSDIISNLINLILRRVSINPDDELLTHLVDCIASLGTHIYYTGQIQDLAGELISRLVSLETQGVSGRAKTNGERGRGQAIRCLLAGLLGLIYAADEHGHAEAKEQSGIPADGNPISMPDRGEEQTEDIHGQSSRRGRVSTEVWHDTLSLLCDTDYAVRADYANSLVAYFRHEMPKYGDTTDKDGVKRIRPLIEGSLSHQSTSVSLLVFGDSATRALHAIYSYIYVLATSPNLGLSLSSSPSPSTSANGDAYPANGLLASQGDISPSPDAQENQTSSHLNGRRSTVSRSRKVSSAQRLMDNVPSCISPSACASASDYAHIHRILVTVHEELPVRSLLNGVPMLLALDAAAQCQREVEGSTLQRSQMIKEILARVWLTIGRVWGCSQLVELAQQALSLLSESSKIPALPPFEPGILRKAEEPVPFTASSGSETSAQWSGVDAQEVTVALASCKSVQEAIGLDQQGLLRRLTTKWTADNAFKESLERPAGTRSHLGDGVPPLLRISPALMAIENLSLQSLTRSVRGVGVTDLREALEGRSGISNPTLVKPSSISTFDRSSAMTGDVLGHRPALTRTRSKSKQRGASASAGDVRDVLNKLGIGRQNRSSLLKASFPALQKNDAASENLSPPYHS